MLCVDTEFQSIIGHEIMIWVRHSSQTGDLKKPTGHERAFENLQRKEQVSTFKSEIADKYIFLSLNPL